MNYRPLLITISLTSLTLAGCSLNTPQQDPVPQAVTYNSIAGPQTTESQNTENTNEIAVNNTNETNSATTNENANVNSEVTITEPTPVNVPAELNLDIPFTSQAPLANWDALHEEACEEASVLMAARFLEGRTIASTDDAEAAILELTSYVADTMQLPVDLTAAETVQLLNDYYDLHAEVVKDFTWDDVKQALAQGYPVIIPAAGQELGNPYYTAPGPVYHMLVVKGYTASKIITNDSGTKHGADYQYTYDTVMNAAHDWNGGNVTAGKKVMIVVKP